MGMSKKHYQALAEAVAQPLEYGEEEWMCTYLGLCIDILDAIGTVCWKDNDRFDYDKFVRAFLDTVGEDKLSYFRAQLILRNRLPEYADPHPQGVQ